jgi:hypothetical protein
MTDYPECLVCKDETENELSMWHKYRTLGTAERLGVTAVQKVAR